MLGEVAQRVKSYSAQTVISGDASSVVSIDGARKLCVVFDVTSVATTPTLTVRLQGRTMLGRSAPGAETFTPWVDMRFDMTSENGGTGSSGADTLTKAGVAAAYTQSGCVNFPGFQQVRCLYTQSAGTVSATIDICQSRGA